MYIHSLKVASLTHSLVKNLNISEETKNDIYISAILHDIGKTYIKKEILNKPARLTEEEKNYLKKHSIYGYKKAQELNYSKSIALNILHHHENYDGTGYPQGLRGSLIPFGARIIKICDVFEALISDRPYREGLSISNSLKIIKKEKETFDPLIYYNFIKLIKKEESQLWKDIYY